MMSVGSGTRDNVGVRGGIVVGAGEAVVMGEPGAFPRQPAARTRTHARIRREMRKIIMGISLLQVLYQYTRSLYPQAWDLLSPPQKTERKRK
jgi:hypothetical protein